MKRSMDQGRTWLPMMYITGRGFSCAAAIYDSVRERIVLQFQQFRSTNPYTNSTLFQVTSTDAGETLSSIVDIQHMIDPCNNATPTKSLVAGAAGSRIQTSTGRLLFGGHNKGSICVWYSDDGGETYKTGPPIQGNEHSFVEL